MRVRIAIFFSVLACIPKPHTPPDSTYKKCARRKVFWWSSVSACLLLSSPRGCGVWGFWFSDVEKGILWIVKMRRFHPHLMLGFWNLTRWVSYTQYFFGRVRKKLLSSKSSKKHSVFFCWRTIFLGFKGKRPQIEVCPHFFLFLKEFTVLFCSKCR